MPDNYLNLAKIILETRGHPMSAQQILQDAEKYDLLPTHLFGDTMHKTLQARIGEEISMNRSKSLFCRTKIGAYFLRSFLDKKRKHDTSLKEFNPKLRIRPLPNYRILFSSAPINGRYIFFQNTTETISLFDQNTSYFFLDEAPFDFFKVQTFSIICKNDFAVEYTLGKHSYSEDFIGLPTIGFRRYVDEFDTDLFINDPFGIDLNSARELLRFLSLRDYSLDDVFIRDRMIFIGSIIDPIRRSISIIQKLDISHTDNINIRFKRRLDIRLPKWKSLEAIDTTKIDDYSRIAIKQIRNK